MHDWKFLLLHLMFKNLFILTVFESVFQNYHLRLKFNPVHKFAEFGKILDAFEDVQYVASDRIDRTLPMHF